MRRLHSGIGLGCFPVFFGIVLLLNGCAPVYNKERFVAEPGDFESTKGGATLTFKRETFSGNSKFGNNLSQDRSIVFSYNVKNAGPESLSIDWGSARLFQAGKKDSISPADPFSVAKRSKISEAIYLWWSLVIVFVTSTECVNSACSSQVSGIYPIGLPIAIYNVFVASRSNKNFVSDLGQAYREHVMVAPSDAESGIAIFSGRGYDRWGVEVRKPDWALLVPYSINGVVDSMVVPVVLHKKKGSK